MGSECMLLIIDVFTKQIIKKYKLEQRHDHNLQSINFIQNMEKKLTKFCSNLLIYEVNLWYMISSLSFIVVVYFYIFFFFFFFFFWGGKKKKKKKKKKQKNTKTINRTQKYLLMRIVIYSRHSCGSFTMKN